MKKLIFLTITLALMLTSSFAQQNPTELLKLKLDAETTSWEDISQGREAYDTDYLLEYSSLTNVALSNVRLEYCIYRDKIIGGDAFVEVDTYTSQIEEISPSKREEIRVGGGRSFKKDVPDFLNECAGCRVRVHITLPDGTEVMQESNYPRNLKPDEYPWNTPFDQSALPPNAPAAGDLFMDETKLVITPYMTESKWEDDDEQVKDRESKQTCFRLRMENATEIDFTGLRAEFCTYREKLKNDEKHISSEIEDCEIGLLAAHEWRNVVRPGIPTSFKIKDDFLNEVVGARVRIYLPLADGQELMREIKLPRSLSDIKFPWGESDGKTDT